VFHRISIPPAARGKLSSPSASYCLRLILELLFFSPGPAQALSPLFLPATSFALRLSPTPLLDGARYGCRSRPSVPGDVLLRARSLPEDLPPSYRRCPPLVCTAEAPALLLFCFEWECVIEGADAVECAVEPGVGAGARGGGGRRGEYAIEEGRRQGGKDVEARAAIRV
jgi:hypothetical protein